MGNLKGETKMAKYQFDWNKVKEDIKDGDKKKGFEKDTRFWKPTVDEKGNAIAIIRFLPDANGTPFAKYYTHNFSYMADGVKKYWIRNCVNTFGYDRECPICKKNQEYWNSSFESDKKIASDRKRKLTFVSNIVVLKNPAHPEDEGKVFLFQYGQKIYDKIKQKMFPSDELKALGEGMYDEYIPFDLYEGANFKLVQVKQGDYPNFDQSEFDKQKPLGSDKVIDAVMGKVYDLSEFLADDKFPTNEEVIQKLGTILGLAVPVASTTSTGATNSPKLTDTTSDALFGGDDIPDHPSPSTAANVVESTSSEEEELDAMFFKNLK